VVEELRAAAVGTIVGMETVGFPSIPFPAGWGDDDDLQAMLDGSAMRSGDRARFTFP
jgi:hypothetical protein